MEECFRALAITQDEYWIVLTGRHEGYLFCGDP